SRPRSTVATSVPGLSSAPSISFLIQSASLATRMRGTSRNVAGSPVLIGARLRAVSFRDALRVPPSPRLTVRLHFLTRGEVMANGDYGRLSRGAGDLASGADFHGGDRCRL